MPVNRNQFKRMIKFIALLKENRYPNTKSFVRLLQDEYNREYDFNVHSDKMSNDNRAKKHTHKDFEVIEEPFKKAAVSNIDNPNISSKSISRDIKYLVNTLGAPIKFDQQRNGFYLEDLDWKFGNALSVGRSEIDAVSISSQVLSHFLPEGSLAKSHCVESLQEIIAEAQGISDMSASPDSFYVNIVDNVNIDNEVFDEIYLAWKTCTGLTIKYNSSPRNDHELAQFEVHVLGLDKGTWFIKGKGLVNGVQKILRIELDQISEANMDGITFIQDMGLIRGMSRKNSK